MERGIAGIFVMSHLDTLRDIQATTPPEGVSRGSVQNPRVRHLPARVCLVMAEARHTSIEFLRKRITCTNYTIMYDMASLLKIRILASFRRQSDEPPDRLMMVDLKIVQCGA